MHADTTTTTTTMLILKAEGKSGFPSVLFLHSFQQRTGYVVQARCPFHYPSNNVKALKKQCNTLPEKVAGCLYAVPLGTASYAVTSLREEKYP